MEGENTPEQARADEESTNSTTEAMEEDWLGKKC